ncbi:DUF1516 family protein [Alkalicoccobacillus murimartini]|uniref:Phosphoglycerol transferase MdoB-like AlkP superfamily enzyme n=1 Tax=Alkalicoccobacillus murimartini TaxID=171685 RepID=A0ABT9YMD9_9BACI|nr:phosphoglycerol transferase MdoB-like AlkP superfamily enzyme [Alkalicoccobacillus murimartini]
MYDFLYQVHVGTWVILLVFVVLNMFYRSFILKLLFRLCSVFMLGSGVGLAFYLSFPIIFIVKLVLALLLIGLTEIILKKDNPREESYLLLLISGLFLLLILIGFGIIRF